MFGENWKKNEATRNSGNACAEKRPQKGVGSSPQLWGATRHAAERNNTTKEEGYIFMTSLRRCEAP